MERYLPIPNGTDAATDFHRNTLNRTRTELPLRSSHRIKVQKTTQGQRLSVRVPPVSKNPNHWKEPKELDPSEGVSKGKWVYISPQNPLVTDGIIDLISGVLTKSLAGIWEAAQTVPAQTEVAMVAKYNVPQIPYQGADGTVSGSPLKGDLDHDNLFWILISLAPQCV